MILIPNESLMESRVVDLIDTIKNEKPVRLYTSGTTGVPKEIFKKVELKDVPITPYAKYILCYSTLRWSGVSVIRHCISARCQLILPRSLAALDVINAGIKHEATHISLTPSFFRSMVLSSDAVSKIPIEQVTFGGEHATQSILNLAKETWPEARITHVYASTEHGDICSVSDGLEGIPKYKLDKHHVGESGELYLYGKSTGDFFKRVGDRYVFVGRSTEMVNVGGVKVWPSKIEDAAMTLGLDMCRAYGVKSPMVGSLVCLEYVGKKEPSEVKKRLRLMLTKPEIPAQIKKVDYIVLSDAGKIKR